MTREMRYRHHSRAVEAWATEALRDLHPPDMIKKCQNVLNELLSKIEVSVGAVTLAAVLDRVLFNSSASNPMLEKIRVRDSRVDATELLATTNFKSPEIKVAFQHLITELFATIGNLTAETLSPQLHAAILAKKDRA